jgi:hypothetical protein
MANRCPKEFWFVRRFQEADKPRSSYLSRWRWSKKKAGIQRLPFTQINEGKQATFSRPQYVAELLYVKSRIVYVCKANRRVFKKTTGLDIRSFLN